MKFFTFNDSDINPQLVAEMLGAHINKELLTMFIKYSGNVGGGRKLKYIGSFTGPEDDGATWDWELGINAIPETEEMLELIQRDNRFQPNQ